MIRIFFFVIFVAAIIGFLGLVQLLLLRQLNRAWWQKTWIRRAAYSLPVVGILSLFAYALAEYYRLGWLAAFSGPITILSVILEICLMFSLPISGSINLIERFVDRQISKRREDSPTAFDPRRRALLKGSAALVPLAAIAAGVGGVGRAYAGADVQRRLLKFDRLPADLEGFKILQLSDMHLRHFVTLDDLEQMLADAAPYDPDLILVTGDIADDLALLPDALNLIAQAAAPQGAYAILGNHEYFRGVGEVKRIFENSPIPLLIDRQLPLTVGSTTLCLGGLDDPMTMHDIEPDFFSTGINRTFLEAQPHQFSILMSHRPDAFPHAAEQNINLTLAGHTHGAQIGMGGRSILENSLPESFLWGEYRIGTSALYTSCGAGHWFPFRLGCPAEAPIIELTAV